MSVALGISILTNLYLFTNEKQNIQQNSVKATQLSTASDTQTKQLNDLKNENNKLTNQIKEESQKNEVQYFETLENVKSFILNIIPIKCTIGIGHSVTLQKIDITNALSERGNIVYDKELAKNREECKDLKKKALITDWYITGSNAISIDGQIVNVDYSGIELRQLLLDQIR